MNHTASLYRARLTFFMVSLGVALLLTAASGFFLKNAVFGSDSGVNAANRACLSVMRSNGFNPDTSKNGEVRITLATTSNIERLVYQSGVIMASCPTYTLTDYCAGAGCRQPGVAFTLKLKEL